MLEWAVQASELHVPSLWAWEILNVVRVTVKRRRITEDQATEFLALLATLNIKIDGPSQVTDFARLRALAKLYDLKAYDVAYLDLAKRMALPLATRDADLARAAVAEGIEVLG